MVTYGDGSSEEVTVPVKITESKVDLPKEKIPVKDLSNLTEFEREEIKQEVEKANPDTDVKVDEKGNATIIDKVTGKVIIEISANKLIIKGKYELGNPVIHEKPTLELNELYPKEEKEISNEIKPFITNSTTKTLTKTGSSTDQKGVLYSASLLTLATILLVVGRKKEEEEE